MVAIKEPKTFPLVNAQAQTNFSEFQWQYKIFFKILHHPVATLNLKKRSLRLRGYIHPANRTHGPAIPNSLSEEGNEAEESESDSSTRSRSRDSAPSESEHEEQEDSELELADHSTNGTPDEKSNKSKFIIRRFTCIYVQKKPGRIASTVEL